MLYVPVPSDHSNDPGYASNGKLRDVCLPVGLQSGSNGQAYISHPVSANPQGIGLQPTVFHLPAAAADATSYELTHISILHLTH